MKEIKNVKGIQPYKNGRWRINITVGDERMTKVCTTYNEALHVAKQMRLFLKLKHKGQKGQSMYSMNDNGQIVSEGRVMKTGADVAKNAYSNTIQAFTFPVTGHDVRIIRTAEGEPWFVARDVAACLGYTNSPKAIMDHCKYAKTLKGNDSLLLTSAPRGINIIPESDVYRLVMRSKLSIAERFQDWVCEEVLPAIRRKGGYMVAQPEDTPEILMARALCILRDTLDRTETTLSRTECLLEASSTIIEDMKPKAECFSRFLDAKGSITLTEAAKHFDMSAVALGAFLCSPKVKWLFKNMQGTNMPTQPIIEKGYMRVITRTNSQNGYIAGQGRVTPKGMNALYLLLKIGLASLYVLLFIFL